MCLLHVFLCSVQSLSLFQLFVTPWTIAHQASLSITSSQSLLKLMSIKPMMPSKHLSLFPPLLLLPSVFPHSRVFSSESVLCIKWPEYWSFSFSISTSNEYSELISFRITYHSLNINMYIARKHKTQWNSVDMGVLLKERHIEEEG